MDKIGQYIKSIREEKQLSLDDLAALTLIKKEHLILLEDDNVDELGGFGVVKSYAYTIVRKLNINQTKIMAIIDDQYPQYKVNNFKSLEYKQERKFLISANVIYAIVIISVTIFLIFYVVDMFQKNEFSIFKAHKEIKEAKIEEAQPEQIIIELPAPSEREN